MTIWNPSIVAFSFGPIEVRWYSLCWCIGLALAYVVVYKLYKRQGIPQEKFDPLFLYCFIGILAGARLGHCLLYEPGYFLSHPLEMLLPMHKMSDGSWKFTGYAGLASHGGTLGLMIALWLYVRRTKVNLMRVLDNIAIATPICACFIRLGNLMNSEIVGKYTGSDMGFVFVQLHETMPRYPAQLYEAIAYLVLFVIGVLIYFKRPQRVAPASTLLLPHHHIRVPLCGRVLERGARAMGAGHAAQHRSRPRPAAQHTLCAHWHLLHVRRQMVQAFCREISAQNAPKHPFGEKIC